MRTLSGVELYSGDVPGQVDNRLAGEDLAGQGDAAQSRRQVQRAAAIAALCGHCLARVQAHTDAKREGRLSVRPFPESALQLDRRPDRLAGGRKDAKRLVATQLEEGAAVLGDSVARQTCEPARELGGRLIPALICKPGIAADIGDQERPQIRRVAHGRMRTRIGLHSSESTNGDGYACLSERLQADRTLGEILVPNVVRRADIRADPIGDQAAVFVGCLFRCDVARVEGVDLAVGEEVVEVLVAQPGDEVIVAPERCSFS